MEEKRNRTPLDLESTEYDVADAGKGAVFHRQSHGGAAGDRQYTHHRRACGNGAGTAAVSCGKQNGYHAP